MAQTYTRLGDLKKRIDDKQKGFDREKAEWFSSILSKRKNGRVKVRFMQELSDEAELYDANRGTFLGAVEHTAVGPKGYTRRALDTMESEGRDWAQEQHERNYRLGWGPKENFYINVAVEDFDDEGEKVVKAAILARPISSDFVDALITRYEESDGVGITDKTFWIERTGSGAQTKWSLKLEKDPAKQIDFSGVECYDLEKTAVTTIAYDRQKEFYMAATDLDWKYRDLAKKDAEKKNITFEEALADLGWAPKNDDADEAQQATRREPVPSAESRYQW